MTAKAGRATIAQIMRERIPQLTLEERVACLEQLLHLLIEKHNDFVSLAKKRDRHHQNLIEGLILDTLDLHVDIHGPAPEIDACPEIAALRRKRDRAFTRRKHARRKRTQYSANIIDLATRRKDDR
jgi:hypothetical protein